jgi:serine protease Do
MRAFIAIAAIASTLSLFSAGVADASAETTTAQEHVAHELAAVVSIAVLRAPAPPAETMVAGTAAQSDAASAQHSASSDPQRETHVLGSGFIIDGSGLIVTNRHVIERAKDILVILHDNTLLRATLLAQADQADIALLKVTPESPLPAVRFGDSDALQVADRVLAIGNPLGLGGSVTQGIVSALNRDISDTPFDDYIQTDAAINHGNSGGPLFNERGEVIGMNTAILSPNATSGSIGLGFAIPSNDVKYVVDALRSPGGMRPGTLDFRIQQVTPEIADALNMPKAEGVIVGGTKEGGAASKCGLVAGDIILKYGAMPVTDVRALARAVARTKPGTVVNLMIWRNDEPTVIAATIEAMPGTAPPREDHAAAVTTAVDPGWHLTSLDETSRRAFGLPETATGVVVAQLDPDGPAAQAGLTAGDVVLQVQQDKVAAAGDVTRAIASARQQQRHFVIVLVGNAHGLRWMPVSLE